MDISTITENVITILVAISGYAAAYLVNKNKGTIETEKAAEIADLMSIISTVPNDVIQQGPPAPPTGAGALVLLPNEFQTAAGIEKTVKAIPSDATIDKVVEGTASNGSKYRLVYWSVRR